MDVSGELSSISMLPHGGWPNYEWTQVGSRLVFVLPHGGRMDIRSGRRQRGAGGARGARIMILFLNPGRGDTCGGGHCRHRSRPCILQPLSDPDSLRTGNPASPMNNCSRQAATVVENQLGLTAVKD